MFFKSIIFISLNVKRKKSHCYEKEAHKQRPTMLPFTLQTRNDRSHTFSPLYIPFASLLLIPHILQLQTQTLYTFFPFVHFIPINQSSTKIWFCLRQNPMLQFIPLLLLVTSEHLFHGKKSKHNFVLPKFLLTIVML